MSTIHNRPSHCSSVGGRSLRWHSVYLVALGLFQESASRRISTIAPSHTNRRSFILTTTSHSFDGPHWLQLLSFVYEVRFACGVDAMRSDRCSQLVRTSRREDCFTRLTSSGTNRHPRISRHPRMASNNAMIRSGGGRRSRSG